VPLLETRDVARKRFGFPEHVEAIDKHVDGHPRHNQADRFCQQAPREFWEHNFGFRPLDEKLCAIRGRRFPRRRAVHDARRCGYFFLFGQQIYRSQHLEVKSIAPGKGRSNPFTHQAARKLLLKLIFLPVSNPVGDASLVTHTSKQRIGTDTAFESQSATAILHKRRAENRRAE